MIPAERYKVFAGFTYVTEEQVRAYHGPFDATTFFAWMAHQTTPVVDDEPGCCYFSWDYERWLREGRQKKQLAATWD
jgi:hypothetical protein